MGIQDRDYYRDELRKRQGLAPETDRRYYSPPKPIPWIIKLAIALALLIAAMAVWRYLR